MTAVLSLIDLSAVVIVCVVILAGLFVTGRRLELRVGNVQASVDTAATAATTASEKADKAAQLVEQVNKAVNCRPESDPTLYETVRGMSFRIDDIAVTSRRTAEKTEETARKLTAHLAHHQELADQRG